MLFDQAQLIKVLEENCQCGSQLVTVEYPEKGKLPNDLKEIKGCIFCTPEFERFVDKPKTATSTFKRNNFRGGRGGRGRSGGGRGRGRPKIKR